MYSIHIRRVFFLTVERRGESLTATNGKIDEGRSVSVWKWLVVMVRFECVIARCLRPPIVACVYIHGRIVNGLRKLHKFTRVLKNVLSSLIR